MSEIIWKIPDGNKGYKNDIFYRCCIVCADTGAGKTQSLSQPVSGGLI